MPADLIAPGMSLASVVLHLRCLRTDMRQRSLGDASVRVLLEALSVRKDTKGHNNTKNKMQPFTASVLFNGNTNWPSQSKQIYKIFRDENRKLEARQFYEDRSYFLRYTVLNQELAFALNHSLVSGDLQPGRIIDLDRVPFLLESISTRPEQHPLACQTNYGALDSSARGGQTKLSGKLTFEFFSPTFFKKREPKQVDEEKQFTNSNDYNVTLNSQLVSKDLVSTQVGEELDEELYVPIPVPDKLFINLLNHWNDCAPTRFPDGFDKIFTEEVVFSRYNMQSVATPYLSVLSVATHNKSVPQKIGALGVATYEAPRAGQEIQALLNLLADFALYAGAGMMTAQGFGQLRRLDET